MAPGDLGQAVEPPHLLDLEGRRDIECRNPGCQEVIEHRIIVVIQGLDQLGDILSFLKSTFGRLCSPENTGFGIARYPLEALNFNDLVSLSTHASTTAFNEKSAYQVSNGNLRRQNLYREIRESYAKSA